MRTRIVLSLVLALLSAPLAGCKSVETSFNGAPCGKPTPCCKKGPNPLLIAAGVVAVGAIIALAASSGGGGGSDHNTTFPGR